MRDVLNWLKENQAAQISDLSKLVAIPSISTDGEHAKELEQCGATVCEQMREAGLQNVEVLRCGGSYPYAYGEWLGAPGKPTVFLYSHHDVQPVNFESDWKSPPWTLTEREGRLYGRGAADDKGAISAQLHAVMAFLKTRGNLPVNIKVLCEGEEEVGSRNLDLFFKTHKEKLMSDVIVVCDTENVENGLPCITYSLRGIVAVLVEVESATKPVHSGAAGGLLADAVIALNVILSRLYSKNGRIPIPGFYDKVRKVTQKERNAFKRLPGDDEAYRRDLGVLPGVEFASIKKVHPREQTWRFPSATIIAEEASSIKGASNQVLPKASAIVSCRIVPDQEPEEVLKQLQEFLTKDPPWGVKVTVKQHGAYCNWWMTDPEGPAFEAATKAMKSGFGAKAATIGCGGAIGFVGPLAKLFGDAPALLFGIEDPRSNPHAPNESLHVEDFQKLTASLAYFFENVGKLPDGKVKGEKKAEAAPSAPEASAATPS